MVILIDESSRILIQGITGSTGRSFAERMIQFGTPLVGGVTPGKGGTHVSGVPVFETVSEAVIQTGADASLITVPPRAVKEAFLEGALAGLKLVWVYTEHVPVHDVLEMITFARQYGVQLIGPNSGGVVSPGKANLSDLNDDHLRSGPVGIVTKSGTLATEVVNDLLRYELGQSSVVCLGGDPLLGTRFDDVMRLFLEDPDTEVIVLIGEIGGRSEIDALDIWKQHARHRKPLISYIAGMNAPPGKRMGHAGAIVNRAGDSAAEKSLLFQNAGAHVAGLITGVAPLVATALENDRRVAANPGSFSADGE